LQQKGRLQMPHLTDVTAVCCLPYPPMFSMRSVNAL
jgi:hypothetical protein